MRQILRFLTEFVSRNQRSAHMFMAVNYTIGDGLIASLPLVRSGFFTGLLAGHPDFGLAVSAYGQDPVPIFVAVLLIASSFFIGKGQFASGHAGYFLGALIITFDLALHGELWTAAAMTLTVVGGAFGAFYKPLERAFGNAGWSIIQNTLGSPKKMAGFCFSLTSLPTIFTSIHDGVWSLAGSGVCWLAGNCTSMLLPMDEDHIAKPVNVAVGSAE